MTPPRAATNLAERYDLGLKWMRNNTVNSLTRRPLPTKDWPRGNLEFLARYRDWLLGGGVSELVTNLYHVMMAGHVFGLTLKPYQELDPDVDLECALQYVQAHGLTASWIKNCRNSLKQFRRYLRLQRGLGEESKITPFDVPVHTQGLPEWLVSELERYLKTLQRNWRRRAWMSNIRGFWSKHLKLWHFLCEQRAVQQLSALKRQYVLDFVDWRLAGGLAVRRRE